MKRANVVAVFKVSAGYTLSAYAPTLAANGVVFHVPTFYNIDTEPRTVRIVAIKNGFSIHVSKR